MSRRLLIVLLFTTFCLFSEVSAQLFGEQPEFESKWVFGGGLGLGFSNTGSNILISPQIGYMLNPRWELGTRLTYNYFSYKDQFVKFSTHNYGGGLYTSYDIFHGLFAHVENEWLSYEIVYQNLERERALVHSFFVGGGYRQYFSAKGYASFMILYNLNETIDSPYQNPMFRIGFGFGL
ncbi:MAG: hypothetical protein Q8S18_00555 [Bacteroidales bacterium]|nr:hypothetical protein [Bacteroidales bacterium]